MDLRTGVAFRFRAAVALAVCGTLAAGCSGASRTVPPAAQVQSAAGERPAEIRRDVPVRPGFIDTIPAPPPKDARRATSVNAVPTAHPGFFTGEVSLGNSVYYLALPNGNAFGYYAYLSDPRYIYHFDLGYEFLVDANDGQGGLYLYDFTSGHWWYTGRNFPFPYVYDFGVNAMLYYYPDSKNAGHYTTNPRSFYNFATNGVMTLNPQVVWQVGGGTLGQYALPFPTDGQCSGVGPTIVGHNATFVMARNTLGTYSYDGATRPGASTCYRNQMNPIDPATGEIYLLQFGKAYVWTFTTVVKLNGNVLYQGTPAGGLAADIPMNVLQIHSYAGDGGACTALDIQNTYTEGLNGFPRYVGVPQGGQPVWNFHSCTEGSFGAGAYVSSDVVTDGEVDNWEIHAVPVQIGSRGGSWIVYRNGVQVYNTKGSEACDASSTQCFWNFGNYPFLWQNTEEPPGWNDQGTTLQVNNMTLQRL